jgi:hypothetical protein
MSALPAKTDFSSPARSRKKAKLLSVNYRFQRPGSVDRWADGVRHIECLTIPFGDFDFAIARKA